MRKLLVFALVVCSWNMAHAGAAIQEDGLKCSTATFITATMSSGSWTAINAGLRTGNYKGTIVTILKNPSTNSSEVLLMPHNSSTTALVISTDAHTVVLDPAANQTTVILDASTWLWGNTRGTSSQSIYVIECYQD